MSIASVYATATTALALALLPATGASAAGPGGHENTYPAPNGYSFTVGHLDYAAHPVTALNGMPTNREVFLDNTSYARIPSGTGTLKAGYFVACAVDIDLGFSADASASLSAGATISPDLVEPSASVTLGPSVSAGIGVNVSVTPGKITDVEVGRKHLDAGETEYLVSRDFHLMVQGCGGPLTIRAYSKIEVSAAEVDGNGAVFADPTVL
ncbi:MspA family porin [Nocardia kruczakiae]|uniref:MspA family porin n=1 Tax=Nocardia kruczakiae TaxID=261477 RepID=UPI0007A4A39C|nr:MspA family porin [Nocardia kruczakiae]